MHIIIKEDRLVEEEFLGSDVGEDDRADPLRHLDALRPLDSCENRFWLRLSLGYFEFSRNAEELVAALFLKVICGCWSSRRI